MRGALRLLAISELAARDPDRLGMFHRAGFDVEARHDLNGCKDDAILIEALDGVWGTIAGTEHYTSEVIRSAADLKVIGRCGVGFDSIDVGAASEAGIAVLTTPGMNHHAVADHTLSLILGAIHGVHGAGRHCRLGDGLRVASLARATVGVVGLGAIGREVARRLSGFGCRILGADPQADEAKCAELGIKVMTLEDLLTRVDILTLHVPLTPATKHLVGGHELASLPEGAIVINTSRGGVVDEDALFAELMKGRISSAGLDVFACEPLPVDHPHASLRESTILSGHVASFSSDAMVAILDMVLRGMLEISAGAVPGFAVNARALNDIV